MTSLLIAGDAKTYKILVDLCKQYGHALKWVLPFPGDWHTIYNYLKVLTKIYWDAGFQQLAQASGYRAETLSSLSNASNFRKSHSVFIHIVEAIFRVIIIPFLTTLSVETHATIEQLTVRLSESAEQISNEKFETACFECADAFRTKLDFLEEAFQRHIVNSLKKPTFSFWYQFLNCDAMAYLSLYISIRSSDWTLRVASLKLMAPVFFAFDRPIYQRVVATHLADILCYPSEILDYFHRGAFTVHFTDRPNHAVAIDEAHEMSINKDCKTAITRPDPELMHRISNVLPFRSSCMKNLKHEIGIDYKPEDNKGRTVSDMNVTKIMDIIQSKNLLADNCNELVNNLKGLPEQRRDLLTFRDIGQTNLNPL